MALMLTKTYKAFIAAGVPTLEAEEAAKEIASYNNRLVRLETKVGIILAGVGLLIAGMISLIVKAYGATGGSTG